MTLLRLPPNANPSRLLLVQSTESGQPEEPHLKRHQQSVTHSGRAPLQSHNQQHRKLKEGRLRLQRKGTQEKDFRDRSARLLKKLPAAHLGPMRRSCREGILACRRENFFYFFSIFSKSQFLLNDLKCLPLSGMPVYERRCVEPLQERAGGLATPLKFPFKLRFCGTKKALVRCE